jgi:hypothetical protein
MPGGIRIEGDPAAQFGALARDLRKAGAVDLRRELYSSIQRAGRPLIDAAKESAAATLPHGGGRGVRSHHRKTGAPTKLKTSGRARRSDGSSSRVESLADRVVNARFSVKTKAGRNPAVMLRATDANGRAINLNALDHGHVRHPVFGNRDVWVAQPVTEGWWSKPMEAGIPAVTAEVIAAVNRVVAKFYT